MTEDQKDKMEDAMTSLYAAKLTMDAARDMGSHMAVMAMARALQNAFELAASDERHATVRKALRPLARAVRDAADKLLAVDGEPS